MIKLLKIYGFAIVILAVCLFLLNFYFKPFEFRVNVINEQTERLSNVLIIFDKPYLIGTIKANSTVSMWPKDIGETVPRIEFQDSNGITRQATFGQYRDSNATGGRTDVFIGKKNNVSWIDYASNFGRRESYVRIISPSKPH